MPAEPSTSQTGIPVVFLHSKTMIKLLSKFGIYMRERRGHHRHMTSTLIDVKKLFCYDRVVRFRAYHLANVKIDIIYLVV